MSRLPALIAHDLRLQFRYGIYAAYAVVVAFYIALLLGAGAWLPAWAPALIVFTDPAAVGFFFLGALMMLERSEGVRVALATTPLTARDYVASKAMTLTGLATGATAILLPFLHAPANPLLLLLAVVLTSFAYVGIGVPIARRFRTVNGYLVGAGAMLTPVIAPAFLALLDPFPAALSILPPVAQLRLILVAAGAVESSTLELAVSLTVSATAAIIALWFAIRDLRRELGK
jgi:fluoroquinolone transport system permease protein